MMDIHTTKTREELIDELKRLQEQIEALSSAKNNGSANGLLRTAGDIDYRHILEEIDDGYWEVDLDGKFIYSNEAMSRILGYDTTEIIGKSYQLLMDEKTSRAVHEHFNAVYRSEAPKTTMVYEIIRKDRTECIAEISVSLIRSASRKPAGFRGILRDITERLHAMGLQENIDMMRRTLGQTVQALALALEVRDPYTAGHHRRVSDLAREIATHMGFSTDAIDGIRISGAIHDIGKISIPAEILSKPATLSEIEKKLMRTHPQMGYDIIKNIDFPWPVAMTVYQHHERIDGSGYPQGITGKDIILEAKIISVADVVEAMSTYRPHRPALGIEQALDEIRKNSGILYDPHVAEVCAALFTVKGYKLKD